MLKRGMIYSIGYVAVIWIVFFLGINQYGIVPLNVDSLPYIFLAPLEHADYDHLMNNTVIGAVLAFFVRDKFWSVTLIGVIFGGLFTWFVGGVGTFHIGASGVIYTWLVYVLIRGFFNRSFWQICIAIVIYLVYGSVLGGVLPSEPGISWQGHLGGALSGIIAAYTLRKEKPNRKKQEYV